MPRANQINQYTPVFQGQPQRDNAAFLDAVLKDGNQVKSNIEALRKTVLEAQAFLDDDQAELSPRVRDKLMKKVIECTEQLHSAENRFAIVVSQCLRKMGS